MYLIHHSKVQTLYTQATALLFEELRNITKETFIAIDSESTTIDFLQYILKYAHDLPKDKWELIKFCQTNENLDYPRYTMLFEEFFQPLIKQGLIGEKQVIKYDDKEKNPLLAYNVRVRKIDFAIRTVGANTSIAGLDPNQEVTNTATPEYVKFYNQKTLSKDITITKPMLKSAVVFALFMSENKRKAFELFMNKNTSEEKCTAKTLTKTKKLYIVTNLKQKNYT